MSVPTFQDIPKDINYVIKKHIEQYLTDPVTAHLWDATPVGLPKIVTTLLLTTTGRKSGEIRHVPLLYVPDSDGFLIIGSKGGNVDPPFWYLNLEADPHCEIRVAALHTKAIARFLDGDEYAAAWAMITELHPVYAKYQARTERRIPVVRLAADPGSDVSEG